MSKPPRAPHVEAAIAAALQRKAAPGQAPAPAAHVRQAITAAQAKAPLPARSPAAAHLQAAIQRKALPAAPSRPAAPSSGTVQAMNLRKRKATPLVDNLAYMDEPDFGKTENYEQQRSIFDKHQRKKVKEWRKSIEGTNLLKIPHETSGEKTQLSVLSFDKLQEGFDKLKGNTESESYAIPVKVCGSEFYFKTSYSMDVGLAPLDFYDTTFKAGLNRPFKAIAGDLDDFIGGSKTRRKEVGRLVSCARDGSTSSWKKPPSKKATLESLIAELGGIFRLDLIRAGDYSAEAKSHQDNLLGSNLDFMGLLLSAYIGIKAARLRDPKEYEDSAY